MLGLELMWTGRLDDAREVLERELAQYELRGMYIVRQEVLCYLAELECRAGRWQRAIRFADESMDIVQESGQAATQSHVALFNQAWPRALLGRIEEARGQAMTGVRLAEANDDQFNAAWNHAVLGFIDLSLADLDGARRNLEPAVAWLDRLRSAEPAIIPCVPDLVEALVGLGRIDDAERHLSRLEEQAQALDRAWAKATALRSRALIAAAGGDQPRDRSNCWSAICTRSRPLGRCWSSARSIGGRSGSAWRGSHSSARAMHSRSSGRVSGWNARSPSLPGSAGGPRRRSN
jgi:tetratricopeptide (TPR) repeat protein